MDLFAAAGLLGFLSTPRHTAKVRPFPESTNFFQEKVLSLPLSFLRSAFAPTQTVVCAYANGRLRVRKQSKGSTYPFVSWHLSLHPLPGTLVLQRMHHRVFSPVIIKKYVFLVIIEIFSYFCRCNPKGTQVINNVLP